MLRFLTAFLATLLCISGSTAQIAKPLDESKPGNALATALAFTHFYARPAALTPAKDRELKIKLMAALAKAPALPWDVMGDVFDKTAFEKLTGGESSISLKRMEELVKERTPLSRTDLHAKTRLHCDLLSTQFDLIEEGHREPVERLAVWIAKNYQSGKPLGIIVICTGNTRRSMLGATMGNIASAYQGLPGIRFASGGTEPDAINPRTIATLKDIGLVIEPTGKEAPRGSAGHANPIYRVQWGKGLDTLEFSKKYSDAANPQNRFAAILVCSEADAACPNVKGADVRIPVPFLDPKAFDGAPFESAKYAERRDDMGRFMLSVLMQAKRRLELDGKVK